MKKTKPRFVLSPEDREEIKQWEILEELIGISDEIRLTSAEIDDHVKKNNLPRVIAKENEVDVFIDWYRAAEEVGVLNDTGTNAFVKQNYEVLKERFTVQQLQLVLNWYHVFDPCLMMRPTDRLMMMIRETSNGENLIISIMGQENWNRLFTLIGGLYYVNDLPCAEDAMLSNIHKTLYTYYRREVEEEFIKRVEKDADLREKLLKGNLMLPFELEGIVDISRLTRKLIPQVSYK